jgi:hypothetical protein
MTVEIGIVSAEFLFWKYLFQIYGIGTRIHNHNNKNLTSDTVFSISSSEYCLVYSLANKYTLFAFDNYEYTDKKEKKSSYIRKF